MVSMAISVYAQNMTKLLTPQDIWRDYDPDIGDFKEEIVRQDTEDGVYYKDSYVSAYVLGEEIRVFCKYAVKAGAKNAPGLLNVHGWMATANVDPSYVADGWAEMSFDYCGEKAGREHYTRYPTRMDYGRMEGKVIHSRTADGKDITDPKQTSHYLWFAIQRRVLSHLLAQKEVDKTRIGAKGYSYGGTLMWNLGMDPRVKAVVAYFGIGWIEYYRNNRVWMYNVPYHEPPMTAGEKLFLTTVASQAHAPYITAATLFLNGSNDHHGGFERGLESFEMFKKGVPWAFAIQARGHHNTETIEQNCRLWLDKYVLNKEIFWPEHPVSEIRLDPQGIPELIVKPASAERVKKVEMYYALKNPVSFTRFWRDVNCVQRGNTWVGQMPVLNIEDYVFGYANITYDTTIVLSTSFNAAVPAKIGRAKATDKKSGVIISGNEGIGNWSNIEKVEGPGGVIGFRSISNAKGFGTEQLSDPKWQAPSNAQLEFKFYCTESQTLILTVDNNNDAEIGINASDAWQKMVINANEVVNRFNQQPMKNWSTADIIHFKPKEGSDINKIIFAEFKWIKEPGL